MNDKPRVPNSEIFLAVDIGTHCGVCVMERNPRSGYELWMSYGIDLSGHKGEEPGARFVRAADEFRAALMRPDVRAVYYEQVRRHLGTQAAHVYGGLFALLAAECHRARVPLRPVSVAAVKIAATGKGTATKADIMAAASRRWGSVVMTEDEADARFVLVAGMEEYGI